MTSTLYLLRQHPDLISSSLFRASDTDMEIIFIEQTSFILSSTVKGTLLATKGAEMGLSQPTMTYDDLIENIFSSEHIIVV
jgi:siroheme synthase